MQRSRSNHQIKIGTRGSPLALYQARLVQSRLAANAGLTGDDIDTQFPICIFTTSGDTLKGSLADFGGKGLFTKELEAGLISFDIDIAVHSMKDVPTTRQDGLKIGAILEREDSRDGFISVKYGSIDSMPKGAKVGTASLRRRAQLAHLRPDIEFSLLRGNVGTRLSKLANGDCDATFLACAGLKRLGMADKITQTITPDLMLGAPGQGAIGIELRSSDLDTEKTVRELTHLDTEFAVIAERAFLEALDGSCRTPIAALAVAETGTLSFTGEVYSVDGQMKFVRKTQIAVSGPKDAFAAGFAMGCEIKTEIGDRNIWAEPS